MPTVLSPTPLAALVADLVRLTDQAARQERLHAEASHLSRAKQNELVALLQQAQRARRYSDYDDSIRLAELIGYLGELSGRADVAATGRLQALDARVAAKGELDGALAAYDDIIAIYQQHNDELAAATAQIVRIWVQFLHQETEAALATGEAAAAVFTRHEAWQQLASLRNNMSLIYNRLGDHVQALAMVTHGQEALQALGPAGRPLLPSNAISRGLILSNLGRFQEALAVNEGAIALATELGQQNAVARALSNNGRILFSQGHYNQALLLFDDAFQSFTAEGRERDAVLTEACMAECYLELRRFQAVVERVERIQPIFERLQMRLEAGQMLMLKALAQQQLAQREAAAQTLAAASTQFAAAENPFWQAITDLHLANIWLQMGETAQCLAATYRCQQQFAVAGAPVEAAQAQLLAGQAHLQLEQVDDARDAALEALALAQDKDIPQLIHPAEELLGQLAEVSGDWPAAQAHLTAAIDALERIQGRLMVEYRADYIADKDALYEQMVSLQLRLDRPDVALEYAERAKSRALLLMLSQRLDLSLSARRPEDETLVRSLNQARADRDNAYRQLEGLYGQGSTPERLALQQELTRQERQITDLWHQLLRRHASYGRDAALWQVQVEPVQPYLAEEMALVEYFVADGRLLAFVVTQATIRVVPLQVTSAEIQGWLQRLQLNLRSVPRNRPERRALALRNVQGILARLHELVMAPLEELPAQLTIVPHGPLHYLPFAALFDGSRYLIEAHTLSYLPGASFLKYCLEQSHDGGDGALVVGHTYGERLPFTLAEARRISGLVAAEPLLEGAATVAAVQAGMADARLIHLATHGEFRADSPLFSGLALADGWLNTLDVFNTRLNASLVTLSACQTGRNVVAGGDELLGLMRAFLSAGAASLISSHWAVDDQSTAALMDTLYHQLFNGVDKAAALRQAQLELLQQPVEGYQHPYFWAPFYLVGDPGPLVW